MKPDVVTVGGGCREEGKTALIFDEQMASHSSPFEDGHPECPERLTESLDRVRSYGLDKRCVTLPSRAANEEELQLIHSQRHVDLLRDFDGCRDYVRMEEFCSHYDSVFVNENTFQMALLAAGCTIDLVKAVVTGQEGVANGMAIVRPPGHHAMEEEYCGYCFFNNVAIAAQYALDKLELSRVLIVDWDVHHGQASQYAFYNDPRVLYFSVHRYEEGSFWPELRESNWDHIGEAAGTGYNVNVPLNATSMENWDYAAIFHQILLPLASEYQPELIIVSSGFDASLGDPEGEMRITPAMYAHMTHMLKQIAPLAVVLEGGYCVPALAEGVALVLKTLLGDPCPAMLNNIAAKRPTPSQVLTQTIQHVVSALRPYWQCFVQLTDAYLPPPVVFYRGSLSYLKPIRYPTKGYHMKLSDEAREATLREQAELRRNTALVEAAEDATRELDSLDGLKVTESRDSLRTHRYIIVKQPILQEVQDLLGGSQVLLLDFASDGAEGNDSVAFGEVSPTKVIVYPQMLRLRSPADAVAIMYFLILPLYYKVYPESVVIHLGHLALATDSPLYLLLKLCCSHLSCEGALWVVGTRFEWPLPPTECQIDFATVNRPAIRVQISLAAKTLKLPLDTFTKNALPELGELPLDATSHTK